MIILIPLLVALYLVGVVGMYRMVALGVAEEGVPRWAIGVVGLMWPLGVMYVLGREALA